MLSNIKWKLEYTNNALKDFKKIKDPIIKKNLSKVLSVLKGNPFQTPPYFEKLKGLEDRYSRRINIKHRVVYEVIISEKRVSIISMWNHYNDN